MTQAEDHTPLVSVIIPAYAAVHFVPHAVVSALQQTWRAREVILVNDGSPAEDDLERAIANLRPRITYIWQNHGGPGAARNAGLAAARGQFVAFLDSDDWWDPEFLREQMALLQADPSLELVYSDAWICGDSPLAGRRFMEVSPSRGPVTVASLLTCDCTIITSAVVARAATIRAAGGFNASFRRGQDFDLWLRLARRGARMAYHQKPLVHRRLHALNLSADPVAEHQRAIDVLTHRQWHDLPAPDRSLVDRRLAYHRGALALVHAKRAIVERRFDAARQHLGEAARMHPRWKLKAACLALRVAPQTLRRVWLRRVGLRTRRAAETRDMPAAPWQQPSQVAAARSGARLGPGK